ncbi:MAG: Holliday junction branch migration DNA helicase RuvB, partial [Cyanobacteria bacterium P01_C01_bin.120]
MAIISSKSAPEPQPSGSQKVKASPDAKPQPQPESLVREPQKAEEAKKSAETSPATPVEDGLRPQRLADYIGQKSLKEVLDIAIRAAQ